MCTSIVLFALAGFLVPTAATEEPTWLREYGFARQQGREKSKPVAVFVGTGKTGWEEVAREGRLGKDVKRLLAENYVCLYVNKDEEAGKSLASQLDITDGPGLVISSHGGSVQAFRHEGDLDNEDLATYLQKYADPDREVRGTDTTRQPQAQPVYVPIMQFGGGGRGC
jgi:hypothetical protein